MKGRNRKKGRWEDRRGKGRVLAPVQLVERDGMGWDGTAWSKVVGVGNHKLDRSKWNTFMEEEEEE